MGGANGAGEPMVRFESVQKSYDGETLVVKDLNLDRNILKNINYIFG